jgi:hypothetical protein
MLKVNMINPDLKTEYNLSGLYFIIDGEIYIDGSTDAIRHNSHVNLFDTIIEMYPKIKRMYSNIPYLEFPRGVLVRDNLSSIVILSGPDSFNINHIELILASFNHAKSVKYEFEYDEHYTLRYIKSTIEKKLLKTFSKDLVDLEIDKVQDFFNKQLLMMEETVSVRSKRGE